MGIQSAVMAEQFGTMFQYGKRRISAMSNEEFNSLTFEKLQNRMTLQLEGMIPEMEKQIQAMAPLMKTIVREFAVYLNEAVNAFNPFLEPGPAIPIDGKCPPGYHEFKGRCIPDKPELPITPPPGPGPQPITCPPNFHWDATKGKCVQDIVEIHPVKWTESEFPFRVWAYTGTSPAGQIIEVRKWWIKGGMSERLGEYHHHTNRKPPMVAVSPGGGGNALLLQVDVWYIPK